MKSSMVLLYFIAGDIDLAFQNSDEAIRIAEESGDIYSKALAYTSHGFSCYSKGYFEEAIKYLSKGNDFCERINLFSWIGLAQMIWGFACFDIGKFQESMEHHLKSVGASEHIKSFPSQIKYNKLGAFRAQVMTGDKNIELQTLYDYVSGNKVKSNEGSIKGCIGEILLNIDDKQVIEAEDWIKKAIKADEKNGTRFSLANDHALYAELFKRKGDKPKAKENLSKAIDIFKECGADGWVEKYEKELATLE